MSTDLVQRRIPFSFDETTPYMWLPTNPEFAHLTNLFSLLAVGLERYIVAVMRDAIPLITDEDALDEANGFLKQEARHAAMHVLHLKALMQQHPDLQGVLDRSIEMFDEIQQTEPLEYRLAFIADLEATFTPLFKIFIDHHHEFFEAGEDRVASLFLWHFIEEVEHRSSALIVYDAVVGGRWYRTKVFPRAFAQATRIVFELARGMDRVLPVEDRRVPVVRAICETSGTIELARRAIGRRGARRMHGRTPTGAILAMHYRLMRSQTPLHDPAHQPLPPYAVAWNAAFERGADVAHWYGSASARTRSHEQGGRPWDS